jgi:hypothetical protein
VRISGRAREPDVGGGDVHGQAAGSSVPLYMSARGALRVVDDQDPAWRLIGLSWPKVAAERRSQ